MKELGTIDYVKQEIKKGGIACKEIGYAYGWGGIGCACIFSVRIACPVNVFACVGGAAAVAAEAVASATASVAGVLDAKVADVGSLCSIS